MRSPRWDSSDPDRAPPPLPLNPSTSTPTTRPNTSAAVAAVAEAFVAKTRESVFSTPPSPTKSPEKSLIRSQYHRRMQSAQGGAVKDLSSYLENVKVPERSPERSPERPLRASYDFDVRSNDRSPARSGTPTPTAKDAHRPASRPPLKSILGESPQSPAMQALHGTPPPSSDNLETSLANLTNGATALARAPPPSVDGLSKDIQGLTTIASNLQREMAALSRRSKDNAVDLTKLKEATHSRDEDIRKSLRDLVTGLTVKLPEGGDPNRTPKQGYGRSPGSYLLEDKPHGSPKSISLPRIPSPTSFAASMDRETAGTPGPYSGDGTATIALLEKILREMGTKEGQEKLISTVAELVENPPKGAAESGVSKQLEEILKLLKDNSQSLALVRHGGAGGNKLPQLGWEPNASPQMSLARGSRNITPAGGLNQQGFDGQKGNGGPRAAEVVSDEVFKMLKRLKDSISEGGGLSAEIKALVRELRGEVLGMGRDIGRKLDQAEAAQAAGAAGEAKRPDREEIAHIVEQGLVELKSHMDRVMKEHRRQSASSAMARTAVDTQEIHSVVQNALREFPMPEPTVQGSGIEREEILEAVREAWETYKPEIELQNFGLERDEILECLKEGLNEYKSKDAEEAPGATYDDVLDAVKVGLQDFKPPASIEPEPAITKDEIMTTVRECLETFDFPAPPPAAARDLDITRDDVLEAVREGLSMQPAVTKELEFNREDLFDAVKAGLDSAPAPLAGGVGEQVLAKMQDLIDGMRGEFQQYSAANGRDTEQVLDAVKDGLEELRASVETYVDRAADVTGKDEIVDTVKTGLENLRIDLEGAMATNRAAAPPDSSELLDVMEKEFEHLRSTISSSVSRSEAPAAGKEELLDAIRDGFDEVRRRSPTSSTLGDPEAVDMVKEELRHMRETLAGMLTRGGGSVDRDEILETIREGFDKAQLHAGKREGQAESILSNTSELLDAFNDGLDGLKGDVERIVNKPIDMTVNYEILDTLKDGLASLRTDMERLRAHQTESDRTVTRGGEVVVADAETAKGLSRPDIENLEVMITQLKIKVDAMDGVPPSARGSDESAQKADLDRIEAMMKELQDSVGTIADRATSETEGAASKDDVYAIETLLRNMQAKIDEVSAPDLEALAKSEHVESVDAAIKSIKESVEDLVVRQETEAVSKKDVSLFEAILKEIQAGVSEVCEKSGEEAIKKVDVDALGVLCTQTKETVTELSPRFEELATSEDVISLKALVNVFSSKVEEDAELTAQAFEARKIEHGGIADKVEEVRGFLSDIRTELKSKIEGNVSGIDGLAVSLTAIGEALSNADLTTNLKELKETMDQEFARHHENHDAFKGEAVEHRDLLLEKHDEHKAAVVTDLTSKIDARFDELMTKYDDAQIAANERTRAFDERSTEHAETIASTKSIADDLRLLIDTLGATVTESCKSMGEDSRTVYTKVEELDAKIEGALAHSKTEDRTDHQLTRAELSRMQVAIESLQAHSSEHNPKVMDAVNQILGIVGEHFEHAQRSKDEIVTSVNAIPGAIPMPALPAPATTPIEREAPRERYDDAAVHEKLDRIVTHVTEAAVHEKLDKIVTHVTEAPVNVHNETLAAIQAQMKENAERLEAFMQSQEASISAAAEVSQAREVEEASVALEKRVAQKDSVELEIVKLSEEKHSLMSTVDELKDEHKEMASSRSRMQAELSSLETALQIRKEEMHAMEARAEMLEKRIMESVMNQSRSLLLGSKPPSLQAMNLKRVASNASSTATVTTHKTPTERRAPSRPDSAVGSAMGMALKKRQPPSASTTPKGSRRILSLSTLGANPGSAEKALVRALPAGVPRAGSALAGPMKRSHSVKSSFPASRKSSWGGSKQLGLYADSPAAPSDDKENSVLEEEEEEADARRDDDDGATTTDDRRSSYTGTELGTESGTGTGRDSYAGIGTESYTTGTGSYFTESVTDGSDSRRESGALSTVGTVGPLDGEPEDGVDAGERGLQLYTGGADAAEPERSKAGSTVGCSDSGLGTDVPTAALEGQFLFGT